MAKLFDAKWKLFLSGSIFGLLAMVLAIMGNPGNMAICIACFVRDIAGAMKLHNAEVVQYFRPEIVGFILGSFLISVATKEYKATAGSAPLIRFLLGVMMMIGALVFLGCPLRMLIRMSAGDINAYVGLIGFAGGVLTETFFLKKGFSLGRNYETSKANGYVLPILLVFLLILSVTTTLFASSESGPGSFHAPVAVALIAAVIIGAIAQKNRTCFAGSIRDLALLKDASLISMLGGLFVVMLIGAAVAHNFGLASAAAKAATETEEAVAGGPGIYGKVAVILCIIVLFIIAGTQKRKAAK